MGTCRRTIWGIVLKTDGEKSIVALRGMRAKYHGGKVVVETPPQCEVTLGMPSCTT